MATFLTFNSLLDDMRAYAERAFTVASDPIVFNQLPRLVNLAERRCATELKVQGFIKNVVGVFQAGLDVYDKPDRWREWISINYGMGPNTFRTTVRQSNLGIRALQLDRPHNFSVNDTIVVSGVGSGLGYNGTYTVNSISQMVVGYVTGSTTESPTPDTGGFVSDPTEERTPLFPRSYEYIRNYANNPGIRNPPLFYSDYDYYHFIVGPVPDRPYPYELNYYELPDLLDDSNQTNWLTDIAPSLLLYASLLEMAPFLKNNEAQASWQQMYERAGQAITGQDLDKIQDRTSDRSKP